METGSNCPDHALEQSICTSKKKEKKNNQVHTVPTKAWRMLQDVVFIGWTEVSVNFLIFPLTKKRHFSPHQTTFTVFRKTFYVSSVRKIFCNLVCNTWYRKRALWSEILWTVPDHISNFYGVSDLLSLCILGNLKSHIFFISFKLPICRISGRNAFSSGYLLLFNSPTVRRCHHNLWRATINLVPLTIGCLAQ